MHAHRLACLAALCLVSGFLVSACDTGDDEVGPAEVAGEYLFTEFRFVPDSPLLPAVEVLDTLIVSDTRLQLFSSGRFTLLYQFEGARPEFIGGSFHVNEERVRLVGHEDEEPFFRRLLLSPEITLERDGEDGFRAGFPRTVNLEEFSLRYRGLRTVDGMIVLRLTRR